MYISNHHNVHFKYLVISFVSYNSIKLGEIYPSSACLLMCRKEEKGTSRTEVNHDIEFNLRLYLDTHEAQSTLKEISENPRPGSDFSQKDTQISRVEISFGLFWHLEYVTTFTAIPPSQPGFVLLILHKSLPLTL